MTDQTKKLIETVLKTDPTVSPEEAAATMLWIGAGNTGPKPERIIRRAEVAARLGVKVKTVDALAARGVLQRVKWDGAKRGAGFRESDIDALLKKAKTP